MKLFSSFFHRVIISIIKYQTLILSSFNKTVWIQKNVVCCPITLLALQSCWRSTWTEPLPGLIPLYKQYPPAHFLTPHRSLAQSLHKQEHLKLPQYLLSTDENPWQDQHIRIIRLCFVDSLSFIWLCKNKNQPNLCAIGTT